MHHLSMFHRYLNDYRGYMKSVTLANENRGTPVRPQNLNPKWLPADACRGMCGRPKAMNLLFGSIRVYHIIIEWGISMVNVLKGRSIVRDIIYIYMTYDIMGYYYSRYERDWSMLPATVGHQLESGQCLPMCLKTYFLVEEKCKARDKLKLFLCQFLDFVFFPASQPGHFSTDTRPDIPGGL